MDLITIVNEIKSEKIVIADVSGEMPAYQSQVHLFHQIRTHLEDTIKHLLNEYIKDNDKANEMFYNLMNIYDSRDPLPKSDLIGEIGKEKALKIKTFYDFFLKDADLKFDHFLTSRQVYEKLGGNYYIIHNEQFSNETIFGANFIDMSLFKQFDKIKKTIGNPNIVVCSSGDEELTKKAYDLLSDNGILIGPAGLVPCYKGSFFIAGDFAFSCIIKKPGIDDLGYIQ
jgi:hypothetical protein